MSFFTHPKAIVESRKIGKGTRIWAFSHVQPQACIGKDCNIGEHCFIENGAAIGDRVTIKNGVCVWKGVVIENDAFVGPHVAFTNDHRPRSARAPHSHKKYQNENWITPILLGEGCSIGANTTVVGPVILGRFCFIGAGSVVLRDIQEFELVAGNPCRRIGWVNQCGERVSKRPKGS